ncbi:sugar phosphate nucleotidyltransferase [Desulfomonile tiedjei]|uniref:glucose-1-phosphate thymidylyltransferase n=1 Tax=Desulfomonile tiedjei (strain ATCC 49306 / DSM 6799 / DCB-1) TaxID=706587 RepID=I4C0N6_DESTA|nr:sugar phosphate nucleotidyltransferase [Desulfomonile tiedjei]AFM23127.1 dTDP-glucose pyrophosphorylase [Desulfomonile tiedjei DSM 6799]
MWGIIPAAGAGSRMQPLAFSKELLPVGSRSDSFVERPRAVSEYLIDRMIRAGATKICIVISSGKSDIMEYYGEGIDGVHFCYMIQQEPRGLCDAIFCSLPLIHPDEQVLVGLPDTVWFPENGLCTLPDDILSFLLFPVDRPHLFDAVLLQQDGTVVKILVKKSNPGTNWIWGAFKMSGRIFHDLFDLWCKRAQQDEYIGTLVNSYIRDGGQALGICAGESYVDVGTFDGYRKAINLLHSKQIYERKIAT